MPQNENFLQVELNKRNERKKNQFKVVYRQIRYKTLKGKVKKLNEII